MIDKLLNTITNRSANSLSEAREKVEFVTTQDPKSFALSKVPNPNDLKTRLAKIDKTDLTELQKAQEYYNKTVTRVEIAIAQIEAKKGKLLQIKGKLDGVLISLQIFEDITVIIRPVLNIIKGVLAGIDGALGASTSLAANGLVINKLGEKKKNLKDNVKKARGAIDSFSDTSSFFKKETDKIMSPLDKAIKTLDDIINRLKALLAQLKALWIQFGLGVSLQQLLEEIENSNQTPEDWWNDNEFEAIPGSSEKGDITVGSEEESEESEESKESSAIAFKRFKG
jgi:hypothetical protein